jgi:hypothetical protein
MSKPSKATLKRRMRELREMIEDSGTDAITGRLAQAMEWGIMWATEETVGWPRPTRQVELLAECLGLEVKAK